MTVPQHRLIFAACLFSALVAAKITVGSTMTPDGVASEPPAPPAATVCAGQTWPNYDADCLDAIARENGGSGPDRVLQIAGHR